MINKTKQVGCVPQSFPQNCPEKNIAAITSSPHPFVRQVNDFVYTVCDETKVFAITMVRYVVISSPLLAVIPPFPPRQHTSIWQRHLTARCPSKVKPVSTMRSFPPGFFRQQTELSRFRREDPWRLVPGKRGRGHCDSRRGEIRRSPPHTHIGTLYFCRSFYLWLIG
jgi:hypothetical protein